MDSTTVNKFRDSLKSFVEQVVNEHAPLRVTRRNGADFVVLSAEDWERDQETLYVLQNSNLMRQIAESSATHKTQTGYTPRPKSNLMRSLVFEGKSWQVYEDLRQRDKQLHKNLCYRWPL